MRVQEDGLAEVHDKIAQEMPFPERRLRGVFEELGQGCSKFVTLVRGTGGGSAAGKTKLDKERHKLLVREMVSCVCVCVCVCVCMCVCVCVCVCV